MPRSLPLLLALCATSAGSVTGQPADTPLFNGALPTLGARLSLQVGAGAVANRSTGIESLVDGDPHTRAVVTGAPYTIRIEMPLRVAIERVSLAHSDLDREATVRKVEVSLDGGAPVRYEMQVKRPVRRKPSWQDVPVKGQAKVVTITVLSNHEGEAKWGGLGEIAVWTKDDIATRLRPPGFDPDAPVFIHTPGASTSTSASTSTGDAPIVISLPPIAKAGEFPRLLFTPGELADLRAELPKTQRGREALVSALKVADGALAPPSFPDPKGPGAQLVNRGDEPARRHSTLSTNAGRLGIAYALSGDKKYARAAAEILRGYARLYPEYPEHKGANKSDTSKVMAQRLSEAMWLIPLLQGYDFIAVSGELSDEDKALIHARLFREAIAMIRRAVPRQEAASRTARNPKWRQEMPTRKGGSPGNWVNFYNTATIMAGALLDDRDMIELAVADIRQLLLDGISQDGLWGEGAIGYQMFALGAAVPGLEVAARQGIDLWSFDNARFKQLFDSPLRYAYPDATMPGINDSARARLGNWSTMVYDYALLRYADPAYHALVKTSPRQLFPSEGVYAPTRIYQDAPSAAPSTSPSTSPSASALGSTIFGSLGYSILRSPGAYALMDFGPHGGVHGHPDKLNLIMWGRAPGTEGDELGGEPKFHGYEDPLHPGWVTQTVAHNTMAVDERSQRAGSGRLLLFEDTPDVKIMRAESSTSYAGALLDRTVVVIPGATLDFFHGRSVTPRAWDRTLRFEGTLDQIGSGLTSIENPEVSLKPLGTSDGYQNIKVVREQDGASGWRGAWATNAGRLQAFVAGALGQKIVVALGPDKDNIALARQSGARADFAMAYALDGTGSEVKAIRRVSTGAAMENGASAFEVEQADGTLTTVVVAHLAGEWQAANWKSDARVLCARRKGANGEVQVLVGGGTMAQRGAAVVRLRARGNGSATVRAGKASLASEWAPS